MRAGCSVPETNERVSPTRQAPVCNIGQQRAHHGHSFPNRRSCGFLSGLGKCLGGSGRQGVGSSGLGTRVEGQTAQNKCCCRLDFWGGIGSGYQYPEMLSHWLCLLPELVAGPTLILSPASGWTGHSEIKEMWRRQGSLGEPGLESDSQVHTGSLGLSVLILKKWVVKDLPGGYCKN